MASFSDLPLDAIQNIALFASIPGIAAPNDAKPVGHQASGGGKPSVTYKQDSIVKLGLACKSLREIAHPIFWRNLDFAQVDPLYRLHVLELLLGRGYGAHVRQLQLTIALVDVPGGQIYNGSAVSVAMAVQILYATPLLTWLEVEFISLSEDEEISCLPEELAVALQVRSKRLRYFGISCESGQSTRPAVRMEEQLVSKTIALYPNLSSLTLHRIGFDASSTASSRSLLAAVSSLDRLEKLYLLDVHAVDESWSSIAFAGPVRELGLVCCQRLSPVALDALLHAHGQHLSSLSLVNTPAASHALLLPSALRVKYNLPALKSLHIESNTKHVDTIFYLERFTKTPLEELSIRYAEGIKPFEINSLVAKRDFKRLKYLSLGLNGLPGATEGDLRAICQKTMEYGVRTTVDGRSSLLPDVPESSSRQ